jgi:NAD(P)-dependent dehydrogenase (short-subunit alcohol dehydrogenase family)
MNAPQFPAAGDSADRTFIVTGANSGLGFALAKVLSESGAHVVLAVRDLNKGHLAAAAMGGRPDVRELDLASLTSIRAFSASWKGDIDVLVNNGGVMVPPLSRTVDGFELQFGTNHLGHFALTNLLLTRVVSRVVTVSSVAHRIGRIDFQDPNWQHRRYIPWRAYGQSKLANLLFTTELQRRLGTAGSEVLAVTAHPGYAATNLGFHTGRHSLDLGAEIINRVLAQSADAGARPILRAALAEIPGDSFVGPDGFLELRGAPKLVGRAGAARDACAARRLWELSEQLTGVLFPWD